MENQFLSKSFKIFIGLIFSILLLLLPQKIFAQMTEPVSPIAGLQGQQAPLTGETIEDGTLPLSEEGLSEEDLLKAAQQKATVQQQAPVQEGTPTIQQPGDAPNIGGTPGDLTTTGDTVPKEEGDQQGQLLPQGVPATQEEEAPSLSEQKVGEGPLTDPQSLKDLTEQPGETDETLSEAGQPAPGELSEGALQETPLDTAGPVLEDQTAENLGEEVKGELTEGETNLPEGESKLAEGALTTPTESPLQEVQGSDDKVQQEQPQVDPNKELIVMSKEELDKLEEDIAKIDDATLKAEMLGAVQQEMQIVVSNPETQNNKENNNQPKIDLSSEDGKQQALQQLDANANTLLQNGANQQTLSALKEAINTGDKTKVETLMAEMAQQFSPNPGGVNGPMGDFDKGMPVLEMMKDFGFNHGSMEMGPMGEMPAPNGPMGMEIVDFKDFYTGVRVEEMGIAMMERGGFSPEQIDQFTDKAKQEFLNYQGEGNFDPKMIFEGAFKEIFGPGGPMMEGQGPMMGMGPNGSEMGPNGSMDPNMMSGGPNGPMGGPGEFVFNGPQGEFNFTEFLTQQDHMMGELSFVNHEGFDFQGPNGPQGFEGPGQFGGPQSGPGGFEVFGPGPGGPFEGPMPGGFDPGGFQGAEFHGPEGFQAPEFQGFEGFQPPEVPEFQPPPELPPPPPGENQNPPPPPPEHHHHDLGDISHEDGDGHPCIPPQCS